MARPANVIDQPTASRMEEVFAESQGGTLAIREAREVVAEKTLFGDVIMAQPTKKPRVEADVLKNIKTMAAAAGERWYYRFPVWNNRKKRQEWIEGISIKGTDSVGRYYGNCRIESVVVDHHSYWMIYSRFADLETGYTLIRPYKADKEMVGGLKTEDRNRQEANAMGVAVSKGQRIVVDHALNDFTVYAFEEAKKSLVDEIGKNLAKYRERCVLRLAEFGNGILARVELAHGRKAAEWLAHDLAEIRAEIKNIDDGLESVDDTWPPPAPPEPKRSDVTEVPTDPPAAVAPPAGAPQEAAAAAAPHEPPSTAPHAAEARSEPPPKNWHVPDTVLGQEAILKALRDLLGVTESGADIDQLEAQNAERLAKVVGIKKSAWTNDVKLRREELAKGAP
jgi:hypothetical protein